MLTKTGHPVLPASLRKFAVNEFHRTAHFGQDKIYAQLKDRYYWPNMIGDIFSKFIHAVALKNETTYSIVDAVLNNWIYVHGMPSYLLTDQGSNVDGEIMGEICNIFSIKKHRSSAYHSQGNGFAERNIRSIRDMI